MPELRLKKCREAYLDMVTLKCEKCGKILEIEMYKKTTCTCGTEYFISY